MAEAHGNVSAEEIEKFDSAASRWWDPESEFKPLHRLNPVRLDYIEAGMGGLTGRHVLDVGCGGGLLSEGLARRGAIATGIDLAPASLEVARLHALATEVAVDYQCTPVEVFADEHPGAFDAVTCLELLEHVPDPGAVIAACARAVRPGGHVFFSTLSRTPKAWALAIVGAEYVLGMLPRGTHDYRQFIRPSELDRWCRRTGLRLHGLPGILPQRFGARFRLGRDVSVNYMAHYRLPANGEDA